MLVVATSKTLHVSLMLRVDKRRGENKHAANKSMDVRAKQLLSYEHCLLTFGLRLIGFAPRHLNRWAFSLT
jgi:hypothetical protein